MYNLVCNFILLQPNTNRIESYRNIYYRVLLRSVVISNLSLCEKTSLINRNCNKTNKTKKNLKRIRFLCSNVFRISIAL